MAQRVNVVLEDDLDGSDADETVTFALDGVNYEIDLSAANADKLREALALYIGHGRKTSGRRRTSAPARKSCRVRVGALGCRHPGLGARERARRA